MTIRKYLHSCLVVEEAGKRLLIDPGDFCFIEGLIKPEDIGPVDGILITHKHADHCDVDALRRILALRTAPIYTNAEVAAVLAVEGLAATVVKEGTTFEVANFQVEAVHAPHGQIPAVAPDNTGYLINKKLFHPGDSLDFSIPEGIELLALPVAAPWLRIVDSLEKAKGVKPKAVLPIHDAFVKDFMRHKLPRLCQTILEPEGIAVHTLELGESLDI
ncbi:MAG: MBL fold metallo-hydrolase [Patescibacteria group bacterium]